MNVPSAGHGLHASVPRLWPLATFFTESSGQGIPPGGSAAGSPLNGSAPFGGRPVHALLNLHSLLPGKSSTATFSVRGSVGSRGHEEGGGWNYRMLTAWSDPRMFSSVRWKTQVSFGEGRVTQLSSHSKIMGWDSCLWRSVDPGPDHLVGGALKVVSALSCGTEAKAVEEPRLTPPLPIDQEASRRMFSHNGMPSGLDRVAAFAYMAFLRAGHAPAQAFDWVMCGQRHRGGLQKLIEQGTPRAPDWVNTLDFQRDGLGPDASTEAIALYRMLRQPYGLDARAHFALGTARAWQMVFDAYLRGLFSGAHAGGLKALQALRHRLLVRTLTLPLQGGDQVDQGAVGVADFLDRGFRPGDARLAHWLFQRRSTAGQPPQEVMGCIVSSYFTAEQGQVNTAALLQRALAASPIPAQVLAESFQSLGFEEETARLAHQTYLLQRSRGHEAAAAWRSVMVIYLSGLHGAGVRAAKERFRQMLLPPPIRADQAQHSRLAPSM